MKKTPYPALAGLDLVVTYNYAGIPFVDRKALAAALRGNKLEEFYTSKATHVGELKEGFWADEVERILSMVPWLAPQPENEES